MTDTFTAQDVDQAVIDCLRSQLKKWTHDPVPDMSLVMGEGGYGRSVLSLRAAGQAVMDCVADKLKNPHVGDDLPQDFPADGDLEKSALDFLGRLTELVYGRLGPADGETDQ